MSSSLRKVKTVTRHPPTIKKILSDEGKRIRLILLVAGIVLVFSGLNLPLKTSQSTNTVVSNDVSTFAGEPVKVDKGLLQEHGRKDKDKLPPVRITIQDLSIDLPVKEAKIVNGYWEVFSDSAGWGSGSAFPDEAGNQVIFAHAREKLFKPLKNVKLGQNVTVFTKDKWYSYKITEIKEVIPTQTEVIAPTSEETLTLYTCSGFSDSKRLIVIAKRSI